MLADAASAPVTGEVRAALDLLRTFTLHPGEFGPDAVARARRAGLSDDAIADVVNVGAAFNIIDRVADAMAFAVPSEAHFRRDARMIQRLGYTLPAVVAAVTSRRD